MISKVVGSIATTGLLAGATKFAVDQSEMIRQVFKTNSSVSLVASESNTDLSQRVTVAPTVKEELANVEVKQVAAQTAPTATAAANKTSSFWKTWKIATAVTIIAIGTITLAFMFASGAKK